MARTNNLTNFLTDVADAIKEKLEDDTAIPASDFDTEILSIEGGIDTSDATATADDIISPKTAYANGEKITGTIATTYKTAEDVLSTVTVGTAQLASYTSRHSVWAGDISPSGNYYVGFGYGYNGDSGSVAVYNKAGTKLAESSQVNYGSTDYVNCVCGYETELYIYIMVKVGVIRCLRFNKIGNTITDITTSFPSINKNQTMTFAVSDTQPYCALLHGTTLYFYQINDTARSITLSQTVSVNSLNLNNATCRFKGNKFYFSSSSNSTVGYYDGSLHIMKPTGYVCIYKDYYINNGNVYDLNGTKVGETNVTGLLFTDVLDTKLFSYESNTIKIYNRVSDFTFNLLNTIAATITLTNSGVNWTVGKIPTGKTGIIYSVSGLTLRQLNMTYDESGTQILSSITYKNTLCNNVSDTTANASDVLTGQYFYSDVGSRTIGTMPNNGTLNYTPSTSSQIIPVGYTSGGTIAAVTSMIDENIIPENIKQSITILGVTGTYVSTDTILDIDDNASISVSNETLIIEEVS